MLKQLVAPTATVWRDGHPLVLAAEEIVPGDLVKIREGDVVPADGTVVEPPQIMLDESALTGESLPVSMVAAQFVVVFGTLSPCLKCDCRYRLLWNLPSGMYRSSYALNGS